MSDNFFTYILRCADGSYYTGWTTDLDARVGTHNSGKGAKYTRSRLPVELVWSTANESKSHAASLEYHIKRLSRRNKERLIEGSLEF